MMSTPYLYVHIPFCRKACHYCDFHFSTQLKSIDELCEAILQEWEQRKQSIPLHTLYFGGGTPSLLGSHRMEKLSSAFLNHQNQGPLQEFTIEANPEDIHPDYLQKLKDLGCNRISLGVQTFHDDRLKEINRAHNSQQSIQAVEWIHQAGFQTFTIDLMYGFPNQSAEDWQKDLDMLLSLQIPHFSAYHLTIEPGTVFFHRLKKRQWTEISQEDSQQLYHQLCAHAANQGYEHYEISNFAKINHRAIHNAIYWSGQPYTGLGPSAHSYNEEQRRWNVSHNIQYIQAIQKKLPFFETEQLTEKDHWNEWVMTRLRTSEGINLQDFHKFPSRFEAETRDVREILIQKNVLIPHQHFLRMNEDHWLTADYWIQQLFMVEDEK